MLTWNEAIGQMRASGRDQAIFAHAFVQHPRDAGMLPAVGVPSGQRATYALRFGTGDAVYVYDHGTSYLARLVTPTAAPLAPVERALRESPGSSVLGATAVGALLGLALGGSKESALVGAVVGGMLGLSAVSVANAESSPATSYASRDLLRAAVEAMRARAQAQLAATNLAPTAGNAEATPKRLPAAATALVVRRRPAATSANVAKRAAATRKKRTVT